MIRINLLPRVPRRRLPARRWVEIGIPIAALAVVVILSLLVGNQIRTLERQIADASRRIDELRPQVDEVLRLEREIATLRQKESIIVALVRQQLPAASVLNEVRLLIPRDAWLVSMNVPEPEALGIEGYALTYPIVAQLMDNLRAGQLFRQVDLTVAQTEQIGTRDVVKFTVTARIQRPQAEGGSRP